MSKNNKALKSQVEESKKKRKVNLSGDVSKSKVDPRLQMSMKTWQAEIEALKQESFESIETAARSVAERVVARNMFSGAQAEQAIDFIETVLTTDPVASSYLKKALKIS